MLRVVGQQKCCVRLHRAKEHLRSKQYQAPRLSLDFHGNCLDICLELLKVHIFKVISVPIMSHIASYGNQYQEIAQRLTEVATCDDKFFLLFATLDKNRTRLRRLGYHPHLKNWVWTRLHFTIDICCIILKYLLLLHLLKLINNKENTMKVWWVFGN